MDGEPRVIGAGPDIGADEFVWGEIVFTPSYSGLVSSCNAITYTHTVTHTGRYTDTIGFSWTSTLGVTVTVAPPEVVLGHNISTTVDVTLSVPCTLTGPIVDTTWITAYSKAYSFISNTITEISYIDVVPLLAFAPDRERTSPPGSVLYTHTLTNAGNYTDTISFDTLSSNGWGATVIPAVTLGPGASDLITVTVAIPGNAVSGTIETTLITATSMFSYVVNGIPMSATVVDTTTVAPQAAVDVWRDHQYSGVCLWPPEEAYPLPFEVRNMGNLTDTFELVGNLETQPWNLTVMTVTWGLTVPFPVDVTVPPRPDPAFADLVWVWVEVPTGTVNVQDTVWLTATSRWDGAATDGDWWDIDIANAEVDMSPALTHTIELTQSSVVYQRVATNTGTFENDLSIGFCENYGPPNGWVFDFGPNIENVAVDEARTYAITVTVPMDVHEADEQVCITARTLERCLDNYNEVVDTFIVRRPDVTLEPDRRWQDDPEANAIPGTTVSYTYVLSNSGFYTDDYVITWTPSPAPAWPAWTASVSPPAAPGMAPGDAITVVAVMTVPAGMPMDTEGQLVVTATSSYTDAIFDTAVADMIVPPSAMARITPDHYGQANPGQWVTYTHIVTNVGNRSDAFEITVVPGFGTAEVTPQSVELAPGESYTQVVVRVYIPTYAEIGAVQETEVIVTFHRDRDNLVEDRAVAHDWTIVRPIPGTRYVAPGGIDEGNNCTQPETNQPCATIQHAIAQAAVGDEIRVAAGVYTDVYSTEGLTQVVYVDKSVALLGGYLNQGGGWETSDPAGNPTILDANSQGRVIYVAEDLTATIAGFHIRNGYVDRENGAGLYIAAGSVATIEMNLIYDNQADGIGALGGGSYCAGPDGLVLQQNTIYGNQAEDGSGAYLVGGDGTVWNNVFYSNVADGLGGGLYLEGGSPTVWHNTFYGNQADRGGGLYYLGTGAPSISNTIFAANTAVDVGGGGGLYQSGGSPTVDYNDYWTNVNGDVIGSVPTGTNSLSVDPRFVDETMPDPDLHLTADSPCVDAAEPNLSVSEDRDGKPRPLLGGYDIGAYEYGLGFAKMGPTYILPGEDVVYTIVVTNYGSVDQDNVPVTDTLSPYVDYQGSVPAGTYDPATRTISWTVSVTRNSAVQIQATTRVTDSIAIGTLITNVTWVDSLPSNVITSEYRTCWVRLNDGTAYYPTIQAAVDTSTSPTDVVKVAGYCPGVTAREGISQVVYLSKTLTLRGGYAQDDWNTPDPRANPTTLDALGQGRVLVIAGDITPTVEGLRLTGGDAAGLGGHLGSDAGGGVYVVTATATLKNSVISGNRAPDGSGVALINSGATLINNAIIDNQASSLGSGLYVAGGSVTALNSTIARNTRYGVYVTDDSGLGAAVGLTNTILADHSTHVSVTLNSAVTLTGVLWSPLRSIGGLGSSTVVTEYIGLDPAFGPDGYHLSIGSGAVDQGVDAGVGDDIDGDPRPWNGVPDLGADELLVGLAVTKEAEPDPVYTGGVLTYTLRVTNTGTVTLTFDVTDTVPGNVTPTGTITWSSITLAPNEVWTQTLPLTVEAGYSGTLVNRVDVSSVEGVRVTYVMTSYAEGTAALTVTKQVTPAVVQAGEPLTYTIRVTNTGDVNLNLTVADTLPAGVTPDSIPPWTPPLLSPNQTWSTTLVVTADIGYQGTLTNVVRVTSPEGAAGVYTVTSDADVTPALTVSKRVEPAVIYAGEQLTYTIYVTNTGNVTLTTTVTDILPAPATHVTATDVLTWTPVITAPGGVWTTQFTVTVDAGYPGTVTNSVLVEAAEGASGVATATAFSLAPAVTITKWADPPVVQAGDRLTYTVVVTNVGTLDLSGTFTDTLPPQVAPGGVRSWLFSALSPGNARTEQVVVTVALGYSGTLVNEAEVTTDEGVSAVYTETSLAAVTPVLTVTKRADRAAVLSGEPVTYTIRVTNTGNVTLTATITDMYPANATPSGSDTWTTTLGVPDGTWSRQVVVTPDVGYAGVLTNVVRVGTDEGATGVYTETTISMAPYLTVTKAANPQVVQAGEPLTYTIYVTNTGTMSLTLTVTDTFPAQVDPNAVQEWSPAVLLPGNTWEQEVVVTVALGYSGTLVNEVEATSVEGATGIYTTVSQVEVTPALTVTKRADPAFVEPGAQVTYTIYVTNTGNVTLTATITDLLPVQVSPSGSITWSDAIAPRDVWSRTIVVTTNAGYIGLLVNEVRVTTDEGVSGTYTTTSSACIPLSGLTVDGPALGELSVGYVFTATVAPPTPTLPLTYTWEADGQTTVVRGSSALSDTETFSWALPGTYAITVTAENGCGMAISRTLAITVTGCPNPVVDVTIGGPGSGYAGTPYVLTSSILPSDPTLPVTYTWSPAPDSGQGTPDGQYQWATPGTYDVTLVVESCGGPVSDTHTIVIHPACIGVTGVNIAGPVIGYTETLYSFSARLVPPNASVAPITYTWSPPPASGQGTANVTYEWPSLGDQVIDVVVENCDGVASDDHTITIQEVGPVYLPLVVRDHRYAPDLAVTDIQVVWGAGSDPDYVLVTVTNHGPAPVTSNFWVDLYLDPSAVPTVGNLWTDLCLQGKAWFVRNPALDPGDTIVLDSRQPDDPANPHLRFSAWPDDLPVGAHAIYAQADSYWLPWGMVLEANETNNVGSYSYVQAAGQSMPPTPYPMPPVPTVVDTPSPVLTPQPRPTSSQIKTTPTPAP